MFYRERKQRIAAKKARKQEEERRLEEERKEQECMCPAVTLLCSSVLAVNLLCVLCNFDLLLFFFFFLTVKIDQQAQAAQEMDKSVRCMHDLSVFKSFSHETNSQFYSL